MTALLSDEAVRVAEVHRYGLLDTAPEAPFDRIVRMAARALRTQWAVITLVDTDRVWFKARLGLNVTEIPRSQSLCGHTVRVGALFEVPDAARDMPPGLAAPAGVTFYAGAPLLTESDAAIGTLCVMDGSPRPPLSAEDRATLVDLAATAMMEMDRRLQQRLQQAASRRLALINDILGEVGGAAGFVAAIEAAILRLCRHTGAQFGHLWDLTRGGGVRLVGFAAAEPLDAQLRSLAFAGFDEVADATDLGFLFADESPYLAPDVSESSVAGLPLLRSSYEHGMRSFVVHQLPVASQRYALVLKFDTPRDDLAEVAELMAEIGQAIRPALQRKQAEDRLALLNNVLACAGSAEGFVAAVESAIGLLCQRLDGLFGMLWTRSADGRSIRLVAMNTASHVSAAWRAGAAAAFPFPAQGAFLDPLLDRDGRTILPAITAERLGQSALLDLGYSHGLRSLAAQSWAVGDRRYLLVFGFATERMDLEQVADLLAEVGHAIRPALQRKQAEDQLALINQVLAGCAEAEGFVAAAEHTLGLLCDRIGGLFGMLWSRSDDETEIRLAAVSMAASVLPGFRERAQALFPFPASRSLLVGLLDREGRMAVPEMGEDITSKFPLSAVGYRYGVRSFVAQSLVVGRTRYIMLIAFATPRQDLERAADLMLDVGQAIRPVLQRKQAQDQLALFQAAVDATTDAVAITDAGGERSGDCKVLYCNPAFTAMMGYPLDAIRGLPIGSLRGPGTDPATIAELDQYAVERRPGRVELLNFRQDGSPIWLDLSTTPIANEQGTVTNWVGVMRDSTERRANELAMRRLTEDLRERTRELADVARMARVGSWCWRIDGSVIEWSDEIHDLLGMPRGSLPTRPDGFVALVHPDDVAALREAGERSLRTGVDLLVEARILVAGGGPRATIWNGRVVRDSAGAIVALRGFCQDVTEWREAEAALRHGEKLRTLGQLTGGIAHDFSNLLTVILANLDLALDQAGRLESTRAELEAARRSALTATDLTRRLLSFARAEPLRLEPTDLNAWLEPICEMARRILGARYTVTLNPDHALPVCAVDRSQLEASVLNLLVNARDAMPQGGAIRLLTSRLEVPPGGARAALADLSPGAYAVLAVRDTGSGMPRDVAARVFEPFFTTKPAGSGSGLGLSMVLNFARRSGGTADLQSVPGQGTTVRILLPL